jgi:hypothetical protein
LDTFWARARRAPDYGRSPSRSVAIDAHAGQPLVAIIRHRFHHSSPPLLRSTSVVEGGRGDKSEQERGSTFELTAMIGSIDASRARANRERAPRSLICRHTSPLLIAQLVGRHRADALHLAGGLMIEPDVVKQPLQHG